MNIQLDPPVLRDNDIVAEDAVATITKPSQRHTKQTPPKKKKRFLLGLSIYFLVLLVLAGGFLLGLNKTLIDYEASTPNGTLDRYVQWLKEKNYSAIYEAAGFRETPLNSKADYLAYLERVYSGTPSEITLRERSSTDENKKQFSVYFDDTRVSILDLTLIEKDGNTRWSIAPQLTYQKDFVIYADADARITVNGNDISLLGIAPQTVTESVFAGANDPKIYPAIVTYTISGLLNPPTVEALSLDGKTRTVASDKDDTQVFHVMAVPDDETIKAQETLAIEAAFTYAKFITRDAARADLLEYIHQDTVLYKTIRNFSNAWFSKHESYSFEDVQLQNSARYTDNDFTCEVKFQPYYVRNGKTHTGEPVHYRVFFLRIEDEWKMLSLTPVANQNADTTTTTTNTTTATTTVA